MPGGLLALVLSAPPPLHEHAFRLDREAEAVAAVTASCERCDWGAKGREAVMDAHPWTYRVSDQEVRREGLAAARPGGERIRDPRSFAYVEACAEVNETRIAFELGFPAPGGGLRWVASDGRGPAFRVGRAGCFRAAVAMPEGSGLEDARSLRFRVHTRPTRRGERPLPRGSGSARIDRVTRLFGLGPDDAPGPSVFAWSAGAELRPDGAPLELPIGADPPAGGAGSVPAAVPLAPPPAPDRCYRAVPLDGAGREAAPRLGGRGGRAPEAERMGPS